MKKEKSEMIYNTTYRTRLNAIVCVILVLAISFVLPVIVSADISYDPTDDLLEIFVKIVEDGFDIQEQLEDGKFTQDYYDLWYDLAYNDEYQVEKYHDAAKIDTSTGTFSDSYLEWYEFYYDQYNVLANPILWNDFATYAKRRYLDEINGGSVSADTTAIITGAQKMPQLRGEDFSKIVSRLSQQYGPSADVKYISWQSEPNPNYVSEVTFYNNGSFVNGWDELYFIPFYSDGSDSWYGRYQYHLNESVDQNSNIVMTLQYKDMLSSNADTANFTNLALSGNENAWKLNTTRYWVGFVFPTDDYPLYFKTYSDEKSFITASTSFNGAIIPSLDFCFDYYKDDIFNYIDVRRVASKFKSDYTGKEAYDMGYLVSNEPMSMVPIDIDPTKVDPNSVITFSGDGINEYIITGADGTSMLLGDYIQNNYTYITNNYGDGSSGSSSSSGTVNVNVNMPNFIDPVDDYTNYLPTVSPAFNNYLGTIFGFLPAEVVGLIFGGIAAAVICRILGR